MTASIYKRIETSMFWEFSQPKFNLQNVVRVIFVCYSYNPCIFWHSGWVSVICLGCICKWIANRCDYRWFGNKAYNVHIWARHKVFSIYVISTQWGTFVSFLFRRNHFEASFVFILFRISTLFKLIAREKKFLFNFLCFGGAAVSKYLQT